MADQIILRAMPLADARLIGRLCANLEAGSPPSNVKVLLTAALMLRETGDRADWDLAPAILRWAASQA